MSQQTLVLTPSPFPEAPRNGLPSELIIVPEERGDLKDGYLHTGQDADAECGQALVFGLKRVTGTT